jgi:glycosyltransferase involved in cell wall biosynthesis
VRILHVSDRLSARGGADWHLLAVLRGLAREHRVEIAVGRSDGTVRAPPCPVSFVPGLDDPRDGDAAVDALERLANSMAPAVIHVHNAIGPAVLEWAARRGAVMTVQDHRCFCPGRGKLTLAGAPCGQAMSEAACAPCFEDSGYGSSMLKLTARRLEAVCAMGRITVLSRYMRRELVAAGVDGERVVVIPPPIHGLDRSARASGPTCVLFAGRLVRAKGVDDAVRAWRRSGTDLPLVFAGTGPERGRLEQQGFAVLGWVPHEQLSAVYRRARALILPARWQEPFGIVGPEALSMGVPVVAWQSGGVADWHPAAGALASDGGAEVGRFGRVVPWGDVAALADALAATVSQAPPTGAWLGADRFTEPPLLERLVEQYRLRGPRDA